MRDFIWFNICICLGSAVWGWVTYHQQEALYLQRYTTFIEMQGWIQELPLEHQYRLFRRFHLDLRNDHLYWVDDKWVDLDREVLQTFDSCNQEYQRSLFPQSKPSYQER